MIPTLLTHVVRVIITMSVTGGAVCLLLLCLKPFMRRHLPKYVQYYFWLVALVVLLVPFSQVITRPSVVENAPSVHQVIERSIFSISEQAVRVTFPIQQPQLYVFNPITIHEQLSSAQPTALSPLALAGTVFFILYPLVAALLLLFHIVGFACFVRKLRKSYCDVYQEEYDRLVELCNTRRIPKIYCSPLAATPMLIGFFRPVIILPNREYSAAQLDSILLHELTHMRRFDIAVKWLSLVVCALHWFNPLVWLVRVEIDKTCELSCDEAVCILLDSGGRQNYGHTLIDIAADTGSPKLPRTVLSTTMCQEKHTLKERLAAISGTKKYTRIAILAAIAVVVTATLAACTLSAARSVEDAPQAEPEEIIIPPNSVIQPDNTPIVPPEAIAANPTNTEEAQEVKISARQQLAALYIDYVAQTIHASPYVVVSDTRINMFYQLTTVYDIIPQALELWQLDFAIRVEENSYEVRWGTFTPDENGWVSHATAFNDARVILAFITEGDEVTLLGAIPWWQTLGEASTPWLAELTARTFLESVELLPAVTFPGHHYVAYFGSGTFDDTQYHLLLSQPTVQGEGGIWTVERWQPVSILGPSQVEYAPPRSSEITMNEYYANLQSWFDIGEAPELADPLLVALEFFGSIGLGDDYGIFELLVPVPEDVLNPLTGQYNNFVVKPQP